METIEINPDKFSLIMPAQPPTAPDDDRVDMTGADMSPVADYHFTRTRAEMKRIPLTPGAVRAVVEDTVIQYDHLNGSATVSSMSAFETRRELLPFPERKWLKNINGLADVKTFVVRPLNPLTRDALDTPRGFVLLLNWLNNCPRLSDNLQFAPLVPYTMKITPAENVALTALANWRKPQTLFDSDDWRPSPVLMATLSAPSDHLALFLSYLHGEPVRDADTFNRLAAATWKQAETVATMSAIYRYQVETLDAMFATYELFRAENFAAIADDAASWNGTPADRIHAAQVAAVRNLMYTYTRYHVHPRAKEPDTRRVLQYTNPLRVARDTATALNIPTDIFSEATGRVVKKSATDTGTAKRPKKETNVGHYPFFAIQQRTTTRQTSALAELLGADNGNPLQYKSILYDANKIQSIVHHDTKDFRLTVVLMEQIFKTKQIDIDKISMAVDAARKSSDISNLYKDCGFDVNARDICLAMYKDRPRKTQLVDICNKLNSYADAANWEPWLLNWTDTDDDGNETTGKLFHIGPRFVVRGLDADSATMDMTIRIEIDPVFFWRIKHNYMKIDRPFMNMFRELNASNNIQHAVVELLWLMQKNQYGAADAVVKTMCATARKNKTPRPTSEALAVARRSKETVVYDKKQFVDDILANTPPRDNQSSKDTRRSRHNLSNMIDQAERVFQLCVENGTILKSYRTHPDDAGTWELRFVLD